MAEVRLTAEGIKKYEDRLETLKTADRTRIAEDIKTARALGDLTENAEYDTAKQEQARIEGEIADIEAMLRNVVVIDEDNIDTSIVAVGASVTVFNRSHNKKTTFQIVGSAEANPREGRISNESPVGAALLGKRVGEAVEVLTPGGSALYEILEIGK